MEEIVQAEAIRTFKWGARIVGPRSDTFEMDKRTFASHEAAGLVRRVRPIVARSEKSSASQAGQALQTQTAQPSGSGATKRPRRAKSSSPTPPTE